MKEFYFALIEMPKTEKYIKTHGIDPELYGVAGFIPLASDETAACRSLAQDCVNADISPKDLCALLAKIEIPNNTELKRMIRDDLPDEYAGYEGIMPPKYIKGIQKAIIHIETGGNEE